MTVENMLRDVLAAERKANEFVHEAEKYRAEAAAEAEELRKKIISEKMKEPEAQVQRIKAGHAEAISNSFKTADDSGKKTIGRLLDTEKEKASEWTQEIYSRVLSDKQ